MAFSNEQRDTVSGRQSVFTVLRQLTGQWDGCFTKAVNGAGSASLRYGSSIAVTVDGFFFFLLQIEPCIFIKGIKSIKGYAKNEKNNLIWCVYIWKHNSRKHPYSHLVRCWTVSLKQHDENVSPKNLKHCWILQKLLTPEDKGGGKADAKAKSYVQTRVADASIVNKWCLEIAPL